MTQFAIEPLRNSLLFGTLLPAQKSSIFFYSAYMVLLQQSINLQTNSMASNNNDEHSIPITRDSECHGEDSLAANKGGSSTLSMLVLAASSVDKTPIRSSPPSVLSIAVGQPSIHLLAELSSDTLNQRVAVSHPSTGSKSRPLQKKSSKKQSNTTAVLLLSIPPSQFLP